MDKILFYVSIVLQFSAVITDKYNILPPLYAMENYYSCMSKNDLYCKVDITLSNAGSENNTVWEIIKQSRNDQNSHDRSTIHRGICVPKKEAASSNSVKKFIETHVSEELKKNSLLPYLDDLICTSEDSKILSHDKLLLIFLLLYISCVFYATVHDRLLRKYKSVPRNTSDKILISLSLISNWEKLCNSDGNEDYKKLKSMQGFRFYTMLLIILLHSELSYCIVYLSNPEDVGTEFSNVLINIANVLNFFLVQIFFLLSSWIVTLQIYNIYRDHGQFTAKQALIFFINRFFRVNVCSTVVILLMQSSWYKLIDGPITFDNNVIFQQACKKNWLQTFFLVNNYLHFRDMCNPASWYLSVDLQFYTLTIIIIYIILKFNLSEWKMVGFIFVLSYVLYGTIIYINEMDIIVRATANFFRRRSFLQSHSLTMLYSSTFSSWSTSVVGMALGILYTKNKHRNITNKKVVTILLLIISFGLPLLALLVASQQFSGVSAAVIGPLIKPLFCAGIGIGILGMSHNIGGILKRIFENNFVVIVSNFSYSIYIFQFPFIFSKGIGLNSMIEVGTTEVLKSFLFIDAPLSIVVGVAGALFFEQPGINLQKMFLPQIPRGKQRKD